MVHYEHPRPALAVDIALFRESPQNTQVLLIERAHSPFQGQFALPGGFVEIDESLAEAASRELREETGLKDIHLTQIRAFGSPHRDPRGRVVSILYAATLPEGRPLDLQAASDAADTAWYPLDDLPHLAFDHAEMIATAMQALGIKT